MILANHGIVSSSTLQTTLLTDLYAVYKAESNANDSLGAYNGTAQGGLTYSTGKSGNAFTFNGVNSYIQLPNNSMRFTNSFSVSFWLKTTSNQVTARGLFSDYYYGSQSWGYFVDINTSNYIRVYWYNNIDNVFTSSSPIALNQWNNIIVVWDKLTTNWKLYVNGTLSNQLTSVNADNITYAVGSDRTNIGTYNSSGTDCLNGSMDEIYVYNKVLSSTDVTALYNSGTGKFYPTF
jgi:hypothetical protein